MRFTAYCLSPLLDVKLWKCRDDESQCCHTADTSSRFAE